MSHRIYLLQAWVLLSSISFCTILHAEVQPVKKWELGIGLGAVTGPDYRGSDEYRHFIAPIPYVTYRGKYLRSDRDGLRGKFLRTDQYEFTLSASATFSPDADDNSLREDMPELGSTIEFGPALNINLTGKDLSTGWHVHLPWRGVFSIADDNSGYIGSHFQPQLIYRDKWADWTLTYRAGISYASDSYHSHYYSVQTEYATATRPAFNADGGYSGWNSQVALSRIFYPNNMKTRLAFFVRYDNISGTDFNASPLVVTDNAVRGGIALIWVIQ